MSSTNPPDPVPVTSPSNHAAVVAVQSEVISMEELTAAEVKALYSKETSKLALRAQQVQIAEQRERVKQKIADTGDNDKKSKDLKVDIEALSAEYLALKKDYDRRDDAWKALFTQVKDNVYETRPFLDSLHISALERLSALQLKETEQLETAKNKDLIHSMEEELSLLKKTLLQNQQSWQVEWGEEIDDQAKVPLKAQLQKAIAAKKAAEKKFNDNIPHIEDGKAIRHRKMEWGVEGSQQDETVLHLGDKVSHYGSALADAMLIANDRSVRRVNWYGVLYGFHPALVIYLRGCTKFLEILDWRAAVSNFCKGQLSVGDGQKFDLKFRQLFRPSPVGSRFFPADHSVSALPAKPMEKLSIYLENDEAVIKLYKELKQEYETGLAKHKKYIKNR